MVESRNQQEAAEIRISPPTLSTYLTPGEDMCAPRGEDEHQEFHWLAYVGSAPRLPLRTSCELWRWSGGVWRSVFVPGCRFTPEDMHKHGWRYCKPCLPLVAVVR